MDRNRLFQSFYLCKVYDLAADTCGCECDDGYLFNATDPADPSCYLDESCVATNDQCVDFTKCININGHINVVGDAYCVETSCTAGYTGSDPETDGFGYEVSCTEPGSYLASSATSDFIACNCDGKNPCEWESDDITGDITEDDICITDSTCPITEWIDHDGLNDPTLHRFINDPVHNTLQADLYDSSKARNTRTIRSELLQDFLFFISSVRVKSWFVDPYERRKSLVKSRLHLLLVTLTKIGEMVTI